MLTSALPVLALCCDVVCRLSFAKDRKDAMSRRYGARRYSAVHACVWEGARLEVAPHALGCTTAYPIGFQLAVPPSIRSNLLSNTQPCLLPCPAFLPCFLPRSDNLDDYIVHDPLLEKGKEKFNKAQAKAKKRDSEWGQGRGGGGGGGGFGQGRERGHGRGRG